MKHADSPSLSNPSPDWLATYPRAAQALRVLLFAVAGVSLCRAAESATGSAAWWLPTCLGLVAGLALAGHAREGLHALVAAPLALLVALWQAGADPALAFAVAAAGGVLMCALALTLRHTAFDWRLERSRDLAWLVAAAGLQAVVFALALPALSLLFAASPWLPAPGMRVDLVAWLLGTAGFLLAAVPTCLLGPPERRPGWWRVVLVTLATLALASGVLAPWVEGRTGERSALWFLALAAVPALVALGGTALASLALLPVALGMGITALPAPAAVQAQTLVAVLALLTVLLVCHAVQAESTWREQRWQWALDGSRLGVADWRLEPGDSFVSAAWRQLCSYDQAHWTPEAWVDAVHPEDRAELRSALGQVSSGQAGRLRLELRMPQGEGWRWLEATLLVIERDAGGLPVRLLATLLDVDERHDAQERQRLSASLFQHLHEGLLITDPDLRVLDANPAYSQILGVPRAELLGQVPSLLRPTPADPLARQQRAAMWTALRDSGGWRGELLERRRSGEICTLQVTISTVDGPQGDLRYHVLVITDVTEQRVQRERLERQAHFDELTRLPNRARLSQLLAEAMRAADRDGYLLAVCYLDLDRFKPVNDRFGHAAGDRLLIELAGRLRSALRTRDAWADTAARLGGDEFVLLLRAETIEEARMAVERVLRVVSQPYVVDPAAEPVHVTASMGATVYPIDRSDADTLLRHADHAMYGAKQSGRNGYLFFDPEHRRRTEERVMAIGRVQEALDSAEFVLHYQPKVDMRSGRVLGFEALLRWEHPQHGLIAPSQFLPLIENTGLSSRVGDWVFAQALEHLSQWRRGGLDISVSVNVSARHLQEPDFAQRLSELLARHAEPLAPHFELEMLETAAHADIEATSALMARCRALGVRFSLDDFGTGYSTLTYLKRLPVDVLKVDRSFVHHMLDDTQDRAIVEGVVGLARTFGCVVVAEGVESPAQARTLLDLGCDIGQGTGIAAPMPAGQVATWARQYKGMFALAPLAAAATEGGAATSAATGSATGTSASGPTP